MTTATFWGLFAIVWLITFAGGYLCARAIHNPDNHR